MDFAYCALCARTTAGRSSCSANGRANTSMPLLVRSLANRSCTNLQNCSDCCQHCCQRLQGPVSSSFSNNSTKCVRYLAFAILRCPLAAACNCIRHSFRHCFRALEHRCAKMALSPARCATSSAVLLRRSRSSWCSKLASLARCPATHCSATSSARATAPSDGGEQQNSKLCDNVRGN